MSHIPPEFKVVIPDDRIAQYPTEVRGESRLLVVSRNEGKVAHVGQFKDIADFVAGDLLVLNETKVLPARVVGHKPGGGVVELLFLTESAQPLGSGGWTVSALINPVRRLRIGLQIKLPGDATFEIRERSALGGWVGYWEGIGTDFMAWLNMVGLAPLPPYIRRDAEPADRERYQTVYARHPGSIAAPTAGLHFTDEMLVDLQTRGSDIARIALHVGWGTFEPIRSDDLANHHMHSERYDIPEETALAINQAKTNGRNVTAVGTTSVRALEDAARHGVPLMAANREAYIFIRPPDKLQVVDRLITNFHRTDSTLLQLVAAMIGWDLLNEAYARALDEGFRFYSYGDAMAIV